MKEVLRGEIEEIWWRSKKLQTSDSAQCDTKTRLVPVLWGRRSIEICHGDNRHVVWEATESVKVEQGVNIPHFLVHRQRVYSQQKMTYSWFLVLWIPAVYASNGYIAILFQVLIGVNLSRGIALSGLQKRLRCFTALCQLAIPSDHGSFICTEIIVTSTTTRHLLSREARRSRAAPESNHVREPAAPAPWPR